MSISASSLTSLQDEPVW